MQILNIADTTGSCTLLTQFYRELSHQFYNIACDSDHFSLDSSQTLQAKIPLPEALAGTPERLAIVHFHHSATALKVTADPATLSITREWLNRARSDGAKVVHQLYDRQAAAQITSTELVQGTDLVLLSNGDLAEYHDRFNLVEWYSPPACALLDPETNQLMEQSGNSSPEPQKVRILLFTGSENKALLNGIKAQVEQLVSQGLKFSFTTIALESCHSLHQLSAEILKHDVVIEHGNGAAYGIIGANTLMLRRTLISGASAPCKPASDQARLSPIISIDNESEAHSLIRRISSLIREPKSLRDLSLRSKAYAQRFHDPKLQLEELIGLYRGLSSGVKAKHKL